MSKKELLEQIIREFKDVTLGDAYTLAEEDYYDTAHCHFDEMHINQNITRDEWVKQEAELIESGGWLSADSEEAIQALKEKRKMKNSYNPLEVPWLYLNFYAAGFTFSQPKTYVFYTPSIMIHTLSETEYRNTNGFYPWLVKLNGDGDRNHILLKTFSLKQVDVLIYFLTYFIEVDNEGGLEAKEAIGALEKLKLFKAKNLTK